VTGRVDALQLNQYLDQLLIDIWKVINKMVEEKRINIFAIPIRLKKLRVSDIDLFEFMRKRAEIRCYGKADDSIERYNRFLRRFKDWGKITSLNDLTEKNVIELDKYLIEKKMVAKSRWNNWHRFLNSFIMDAIDEGYIQKNPYRWVNIDRGDENTGIDNYLTSEELRQLSEAQMPSDRLERVRDVFVFQCHTCLAYKDLKDFKSSDIENVDGHQLYRGKRGKSGIEFTIPLLPKALEILAKYDSQLPVISNVKYNKYVKEVAEAAGIKKKLTTHWARHTGATMLLNAGVPMQVVSKVCGHSSTKMTERVYAKLLDKTVIEAVQKVEDKI
jgi:site-specific recombinase XerD